MQDNGDKLHILKPAIGEDGNRFILMDNNAELICQVSKVLNLNSADNKHQQTAIFSIMSTEVRLATFVYHETCDNSAIWRCPGDANDHGLLPPTLNMFLLK